MTNCISRFVAHLVCISVLGSSGSAYATVIDLGTITRDTDTGLDWLDVSATANLSYNQVVASALVQSEGWRYATEAEVCVWFSPTCPGSELIPRAEYTAWVVSPGDLLARYGAAPVPGFHSVAGIIVVSDPYPHTAWTVGVADAFDDNPVGNGMGSLLVRPVPEPATAVLVGGGILGLAARRRRG
jgi:hypothetical protein